MKIIPLINEFTQDFNEKFNNSVNPLSLESSIKEVGDKFITKFYEAFLNYLDERFKNSKERKVKYYVKETTRKTLITSIGIIQINMTSYYTRDTKERFVFLRKVLDLKPYKRLTNEAEYELIKEAKNSNATKAAATALRNTKVSKSLVSNLIRNLNGTANKPITRSASQPDVLYIEMDEVHANLQHNGNKICPCAIVHEGHKETFVKRKELKNVKNFASAKLNYEELWEVIYDYVDKKYDIDKFKAIFISGDGASGIKNFKNCFPDAIFVLDKFHFAKALKYIFKNDTKSANLGRKLLKENKTDEFRELVDAKSNEYPESANYIKAKGEYLISNIDGILNQKHELYECPCAMEGHVSNAYARYITSNPYGFSISGLENRLKLLVMKADKAEFTIQDYYNMKNGTDEYEDIIVRIKKLGEIKYDQRLSRNRKQDIIINTQTPLFDNVADANRYKELTSCRNEIYII